MKDVDELFLWLGIVIGLTLAMVIIVLGENEYAARSIYNRDHPRFPFGSVAGDEISGRERHRERDGRVDCPGQPA